MQKQGKSENIQNRNLAKIQSIVGVTGITLAQLMFKLLSRRGIPIHFALLVRGTINFFINLFIGAQQRLRTSKDLNDLQGWLILRSFLGTFVALIYFGVLQFLQITIINTIWMLCPLLSHFSERIVFGNQIKSKQFIITILGFLGVLIFLNPVTAAQLSIKKEYIISGWVLVCAACLNSFTLSIVKWFSSLQTFIILHYFYLFNIGGSLFSLHTFSDQFNYDLLSQSVFSFLLLACCFSYTGQTFTQKAIINSNSKLVSSFNYFGIILGYVFDVVLLGQQIIGYKLLGVAVIMMSTALNLFI